MASNTLRERAVPEAAAGKAEGRRLPYDADEWERKLEAARERRAKVLSARMAQSRAELRAARQAAAKQVPDKHTAGKPAPAKHPHAKQSPPKHLTRQPAAGQSTAPRARTDRIAADWNPAARAMATRPSAHSATNVEPPRHVGRESRRTVSSANAKWGRATLQVAGLGAAIVVMVLALLPVATLPPIGLSEKAVPFVHAVPVAPAAPISQPTSDAAESAGIEAKPRLAFGIGPTDAPVVPAEPVAGGKAVASPPALLDTAPPAFTDNDISGDLAALELPVVAETMPDIEAASDIEGAGAIDADAAAPRIPATLVSPRPVPRQSGQDAPETAEPSDALLSPGPEADAAAAPTPLGAEAAGVADPLAEPDLVVEAPLELPGSIRVALMVPAQASPTVRDGASQALESAGVPGWDEARTGFSIAQSQLRYYHAADADAARALAERLGVEARDFTQFRPSPDEGYLEIWLAGRGGGTRSQGNADTGQQHANGLSGAVRSFSDALRELVTTFPANER